MKVLKKLLYLNLIFMQNKNTRNIMETDNTNKSCNNE